MRAVLATMLSGCAVTGTFPCETHDACRVGDAVGYCEAAGFCSFIDDTCPTRRKFHDSAGDGLGGTCVTGIVTGTHVRRTATNDPGGLPVVVDRVYAASELQLGVMLEDGTRPAIERRPGEFSFPMPTPQHYQVSVTIDGATEIYQGGAGHIAIVQRDVGRFDRAPFTMSANLAINAGAIVTSGNYDSVLSSTGVWARADASNGSSFSFDWRDATPLSAPHSLLDATKHDRLYYTRHVVQPAGHRILVAAGTGQATLRPGMSTPVTLAAVPMEAGCVHLVAPFDAAYARLVAIRPANYSQVDGWQIDACPAPDALGTLGGLELASKLPPNNNGDVAPRGGSNPSKANVDLDQLPLNNPFPGTTPVTTMVAEARHAIALPGTSGATVSNQIRVSAPFAAAATCTDRVPDLSSTIGIAGDVTIGGTLVDTNGAMLKLDRTRPVAVAWPMVGGSAAMYRVTLYQLTAVSSTGGDYTRISPPLASVYTFTERAMLDPVLLTSGDEFVLSIEAFASAGPRHEASFVYSRWFRVP